MEVGITDSEGNTSYGIYRKEGKKLLPVLQNADSGCRIYSINGWE
jgi:hypothetical protein